MHILVYSFDFHPCLGGVDTYVRHLIRGLRKRGHTVDFLCSSHIRILPSENQHAIAAYRSMLENSDLPPAIRQIEYLKYANELLVNSIDLLRYDLVHSNNGVTSYIINKVAPQLPLIGTVHGSYYEESLMKGWVSSEQEAEMMRLYDQYAVECPDIVHMVSHAMLQRVRAKEGKKYVVVHHGLPQEDFSPTFTDHDPIRIACSGVIAYVKGYDILMDALIMLKDEMPGRYEIVIYGDGPLKNELEQVANKHQLPVRFPGMVSHEIIRKELPNYDIFVQPSRFDSFGLSVTEALASGCAVICSDTGGLKEQIVHEYNGLLFETGNARQLADSIRRLIEDVELRSKLRQNGVRTVRERFSEQVMMDQYEQLYAEAMELKQWRAMKV